MENRNGHAFRPCPLCGSPRSHAFLTEQGSRYVRCVCGHVYQNPRPNLQALLDHYQDYFPERENEIEAFGFSMERVYRDACRVLSRMHPAPGSLLDIGCGFGFFMDVMRRHGWSVQGCDVSHRAALHVRDRFGIAVHEIPFEHLELPVNSMDAVTGFYVIEHVLDPVHVLRKIHGLLRPGGTLLLRFPNTAPIVRWGRLFGRWDLFHAPWHLSDFSRTSMEHLLARCGFSEIRFMAGGYTRPQDAFGRWCSRLSTLLCSGLERPCGGRWIPPGLSRTVTARKPSALRPS